MAQNNAVPDMGIWDQLKLKWYTLRNECDFVKISVFQKGLHFSQMVALETAIITPGVKMRIVSHWKNRGHFSRNLGNKNCLNMLSL